MLGSEPIAFAYTHDTRPFALFAFFQIVMIVNIMLELSAHVMMQRG